MFPPSSMFVAGLLETSVIITLTLLCHRLKKDNSTLQLNLSELTNENAQLRLDLDRADDRISHLQRAHRRLQRLRQRQLRPGRDVVRVSRGLPGYEAFMGKISPAGEEIPYKHGWAFAGSVDLREAKKRLYTRMNARKKEKPKKKEADTDEDDNSPRKKR